MYVGGSAGVELDSLSRDATNRLSSGFSPSVETRRWFGWLRMVFTRCTSSELQFRVLREVITRDRGNCRGKPGRAQQHAQAYHSTFYLTSKHQIRRGRRVAQSLTSHGSSEPLCARIKGVNREVSEGKCDLLPRSVFSLRGLTRSGERGIFLGKFSDIRMALDGWMLARAPASPAQGLHYHGPRCYNSL